MPNTQEISNINEKNIKYIKNAVDIREIEDYKENYNLDLLYYIPFLSNSSNIDIYNITETNILNPANLISKNGFIDNENSSEDLISNINGYYIFKNSSLKKDLYYIENYNTNITEIENNGITNSYKYMTNENWHNFMFSFSTNNLSERIIAILNNSTIISINENQYLLITINLINTDYNELYTISLQTQSKLKINNKINIIVTREQYMGRYKFSLFINGMQSDTQITELDYNELNLVDRSTVIYKEEPIQTLFWFHEDPGIETILDELYLFKASSNSSFIVEPTNYTILPLPADIVTKSNTHYNYNINIENKFNSHIFNAVNKKINYNTKRKLISHTYTNTSKSINKNIKEKFDLIQRNIEILNTKEYNIKSNNLINKIVNINTNRFISKKFDYLFDCIQRNLIKGIDIYITTFRFINKKDIITKYSAIRTILTKIKKNNNLARNIYRNVIIYNNVSKNVLKSYIINLNTKKIVGYYSDISFILNRNIIKNIDNKFNTKNFSCKKIINNNNTAFNNVISIINRDNLKRNIHYNIILRNKTKFKYGDIDEYETNTSRIISSNKTVIFNSMLKFAVPVKTESNIKRNIKYKNTAWHNIIKISCKKIINIHDIKLFTTIRDLDLHAINRNIEKVITIYFNTERAVQPRRITWAFVIRTQIDT